MSLTARRSPNRVAELVLPQIDMMLAARATLLGLLDCDDSHTIAEQCTMYVRDHRIKLRYMQQLKGENI